MAGFVRNGILDKSHNAYDTLTMDATQTKGNDMNSYQITNRTSGKILGTYDGLDQSSALDAMARDAGYTNYDKMCEEVGGGADDLHVTELTAADLTYQAIEDDGGGLHLAVFAGDDCKWLMSNFEILSSAMVDCIDDLRGGRTPAGWDGLSDDPAGEYDQLTATEHGWRIVADNDGVYYDRMGAAASKAFAVR
jgi:hypothetical protein